jgi:transposase/IS5 family transposase
MAKYKRYDYAQKIFIPVFLEDQLMPGTLEFVIHTLIENRMDMSIFDDRYKNDETGRHAYDPRILLKVVLLAYSRGLTSSRPIERACKENVTFMALTCGTQPDHSTIAAFVSSMQDEIPSLFADVLLVCEEEDLLGGTFFAIDGCKLPSNASKQSSGKISDIRRKKDRIETRVRRLVKEQIETDKDDEERDRAAAFSDRLNREKQIERLQKKAERLEEWLKENDAKIGRQGREIKSNVTDNESATMRTSHGTIQGYNGQALVDDKKQVIVHAEVFGDGQDHYHVPPVIDGAKENMKALGHAEDYFEETILTADALYHSATNMEKCEKEKIDAYIPDKSFRRRDPSLKTTREYSGRESKRIQLKEFQHREADDVYICPMGKVLKLKAKNTRGSHGRIQNIYAADDCTGCEIKTKCISRKNGKRRHLTVRTGTAPGNRNKAMADKIDTEKGRKTYNRRFAIVEPVFGNIRSQKRLDRFTLRGKIKVNIQWLLYCMVHNMGKVANYGSI